MAEQNFAVGLAAGIQVDASTVNATIDGLSGALDSSDGIVLGVSDAGTGETGITLPTFVREAIEKADVPGSFTRVFNSFVRVGVESFDITFLMQGNGVASTPSAGEAKPLPGIDALLQIAGLVGTNGTAPIYTYTPSPTTKYATIKLWVEDMSFTLLGCTASDTKFEFLGGTSTKVIQTINVSSIHAQSDGVALPTFDYTTQSSLSAPVLKGAGFDWGPIRGFRNLDITIANSLEEVEDSNQPEGLRVIQSDRSIDMSGQIYVDDADTDFEFQNLQGTVAPTNDATFQLGDIAAPTDTINGVAVAMNNIQADNTKSERIGDLLAWETTAHATGTVGGSEFSLSFN